MSLRGGVKQSSRRRGERPRRQTMSGEVASLQRVRQTGESRMLFLAQRNMTWSLMTMTTTSQASLQSLQPKQAMGLAR